MSTKTTFKRIALVAVAALGLGLLSVAPSQATVINLTSSAVDGTATTAKSDSTTAATVRVSFTSTASSPVDSVTVTSYVSSKPSGSTAPVVSVRLADTSTSTGLTMVSTGGANLLVAPTTAVTSDSVTVIAAPNAAASNSANLGYFFASVPATAGTYTITSIITPFSAGVGGTAVTRDANIVVTASAADSKVASAANSTAFLSLGDGSNSDLQSVDSAVAVVATASAADIAELNIILENANGTASKVVESVTATISGPGTIGTSAGTYGKTLVIAYNADARLTFGIRADGTAGVATITVSTPSVSFAPKSVTFYSKVPKTLTAAVAVPVLGVSANADAVSVTAVDANGSNWAGAAYIYASAAADALIAGSTTPVACSWSSDDLVHYCPVTGVSVGTAKLKVIDASTVALATVTSNEVTVTVSASAPASVKLSFDKATYAPFEKATITVTPLDATGKAIPAQTDKALLAAGGITSTFAFSAGSDTLTASTFSTSALTGVKTYTVYMPAASGDITITATGGAAVAPAGQVKVTATAAIANSSVDAATDAANEATDAANAATDAALAAADAADAATAAAEDASAAVATLATAVNTALGNLKKQITALTKLVNKLLKK